MADRREFLKNGATAAAAAVVGSSAFTTSLYAKTTYNLKLATTWPTNMPVFMDAVERFVKNVEEMTAGDIKIRVDTANKHKAAFGVFDMVRAGQYDMAHTASYYWKGKEPATMLFTTTPFGMTAQEQNAWIHYGGGQELMDEVYAKHNLVSYNGGNTSNQMGGWFRKEIKTIDDFKGLKMRIPGFAGEVLARVGASPTNIAPGELYTALEKGTIDALEWVGPALDVKMGFQKIAPYYYTGWHEPATELQFLLNKQKFDKMPADIKKLLEIAMNETSYDMLSHSMDANAKVWKQMKVDYPEIKVRTFPKAVVDRLKVENEKALDELANSDATAKKVLDSLRSYTKDVRAVTEIGDLAYLNMLNA